MNNKRARVVGAHGQRGAWVWLSPSSGEISREAAKARRKQKKSGLVHFAERGCQVIQHKSFAPLRDSSDQF
ncbi:MAG: hypothetical protein ACWGMZ_01290 [Thermoguttaceae bacterium]